MALAFELVREEKRTYLVNAPETASVRRARRGMDQQGPGQGVVPQFVAAHLLRVESASDAVLLRASGLEHDLDSSTIAPTYPPSSADGSGSTGYDEAHRSGHVFPNNAVPLVEQTSANPAAIQQRTHGTVDKESSEEGEREEDWGESELYEDEPSSTTTSERRLHRGRREREWDWELHCCTTSSQ